MFTDQTQDDGKEPAETDGVVRFNAPLAWIDWWVKGRHEGETEPPGRPEGC